MQTGRYCSHVFQLPITANIATAANINNTGDPALIALGFPHRANIKSPVHQPKQLYLRHNRKSTDPILTTKSSIAMPSQTSSSGSSGSSGQGYSVTGSGTNSQVCCAFASRAPAPNGRNSSQLFTYPCLRSSYAIPPLQYRPDQSICRVTTTAVATTVPLPATRTRTTTPTRTVATTTPTQTVSTFQGSKDLMRLQGGF